jgi:hypothetical protein
MYGPKHAVANYFVEIDDSSPITTCQLDGLEGMNGWHVSDVTVTLSATDYWSGVESTLYRINGDSWQTYVGPFTISSEGAYTVEYYSMDYAGNDEIPHNVPVNIDETPPVVIATYPAANANGWYKTDVTIDFSATDAVSGVWVAPTDVTLYEGEAQSATGYAMDLAGNVGSYTVSGINIDKTPPAVSAIYPAANSNDWYNYDVTVEFSATDALSGLWLSPADVTLGEG